MTAVVLASASASRRAMLRAAGLEFAVRASDVDESEIKRALIAKMASPRAMAQQLAAAKALAISREMPGALVIGSDQILALDDGTTLDKAPDMAVQKAQLQALRGQAHSLISAAAIAENGVCVWHIVDSARLYMRDFSDGFLDDYLAAEGEALLWGVGGYRIEGRGVQLFSRVEGSLFTVQGLPLLGVLDYLRERGVLAR